MASIVLFEIVNFIKIIAAETKPEVAPAPTVKALEPEAPQEVPIALPSAEQVVPAVAEGVTPKSLPEPVKENLEVVEAASTVQPEPAVVPETKSAPAAVVEASQPVVAEQTQPAVAEQTVVPVEQAVANEKKLDAGNWLTLFRFHFISSTSNKSLLIDWLNDMYESILISIDLL